MLSLYVKRAKIFLHHVNGREVRCALGRQDGPQDAPDWVLDAPGFKEGVADKSIVNLTPPKATRTFVEEPEAEDPEAAEPAEDTEEDLSEEKAKKAEARARKPKGSISAAVTKHK